MLRLYRVALTGREDRWVSIAGMSGKWKTKGIKNCLIVNSPTAPTGVGQHHRNGGSISPEYTISSRNGVEMPTLDVNSSRYLRKRCSSVRAGFRVFVI